MSETSKETPKRKKAKDTHECPEGFPPEKWEKKTESEKAAWWWAFSQSQKKRGER